MREFGRRTAAEPDAANARALIDEYDRKFAAARTVLPAAPDEAPLEDLLLRVRRAYWEGLGG